MTKASNIYELPRYRAELRSLTPAEREYLEFVARKTNGMSLTRLTGSYVANAKCVSRQYANRMLNRLQELGLLVRLKTGLVQLRLKNLLNISARAAKCARRKMSKSLKRLFDSGRGNNVFPKLKKEIKTLVFSAPAYSKEALANDYEAAKGRNSGNISAADLLRMRKRR